MARAFRAYERAAEATREIPCQPSSASDVEKIGARWYAVSRNVNGVLAVYLIGKCDKLRRIESWPKSLERW